MTRKILIDLSKYRDGKDTDPSPGEAVCCPSVNLKGLQTIRELAVFRYSCRKCAEAPCIAACPADALERDSDGVISRAIHLCISCKSCVVICPFGTMMTDFFRFKRDKSKIFDLNDDTQLEEFMKASPPGSVRLMDSEISPDEGIYQLNEKVWIKEWLWDYNRL